MRKQGDGYVYGAKNLLLIMTPYRLRHYDAFRSPLLVTCFPKIVILNGARMLCEKAGKRDGEME